MSVIQPGTQQKGAFVNGENPRNCTEGRTLDAKTCSRCKNIDLESVFSGSYDIDLSPFANLPFNESCQLCRLLNAVFPTPFDLTKKIPWLHSCYQSGFEMSEGTDIAIQKTCLRVRWVPKGGTWDDIERPPRSNAGCILRIRNPSTVAALQRPEIDFSMLKSWIKECCETHTTISHRSDQLKHIPGMRVIDVRTHAVVPATTEFNYAALSYVWGANQTPETVDHLDEAPKVIEDALEVATKLDIPYLWVDRYCIDQHNKEEKHALISKMHFIYRNARVTLVAAAGTGSEHGIPGVRGTPRPPQPHVIRGEDLLVTKLPHPLTAIQYSTWGSRGWTYQEAVLSTRILAFTDAQIYFECHCEERCEAIDEPLARLGKSQPIGLHRRSSRGLASVASSNGQAYLRIRSHISEVARRDFSYDEDRVDALRGIFGDMEESGSLSGHLWGVPILILGRHLLCPRTAGFLTGLCWDTRRPTERCLAFPSWTWAGWKDRSYCRVSRKSYVSGTQIEVCFGTSVKIWVELQDGALVNIEDYHDQLVVNGRMSLVSHFIHIEALTIKCRFKYFADGMQAERCWYYSNSLLSLTQDESTSPGLSERLASDSWDVLLFKSEYGGFQCLVVDWIQDHAQRLGTFYLQHLPSAAEKRTVRLG